MRPNRPLTAAAAALACGLAFAQAAPAQDHTQHHPEGAATPPATTPPSAAPKAGGPDRHAEQMKQMREMHERLRAAKTPAERQALLGEQAKLMQQSMGAMREMRMHRGGGGGGGEHGMMAMHDTMGKRMEMMEMMMQMLVDRAAPPTN